MERVIARSEEMFEGRRLLIKNGKSFEGRPMVKKMRYQVQKAPLKDDVVKNEGGQGDRKRRKANVKRDGKVKAE